MPEYIEQGAAKRAVDLAMDLTDVEYDMICNQIDKLPAADVEPVRHGKWEWLEPNRLVRECMCGTCPVCKVRSQYIINTLLCPNCGANMDGGEENAD